MNFPKLPDGPSSIGSAAVRATQNTGTTFQTRRGVGFVARVKDGFSRVELEDGVAYIAAGQYKADRTGSFATLDYRQPFKPSAWRVGVTSGAGTSAYNRVVSSLPLESGNFTYPREVPEALPENTRTFERGRVVQEQWLSHTGLSGHKFEVVHVHREAMGTLVEKHSTSILAPLHYVGRVEVGDLTMARAAVVYRKSGGRVDGAGRPLSDPAITFFHTDGTHFDATLPIPEALVEYEVPKAAFSAAVMFVVVWAKFRYTGAREIGRDFRPAVWLLKSEDQGETWSGTDFREPIAAGMLQRIGGGFLQRVVQIFFPSTLPGTELVSIPLVDGKPVITDLATYSYTRNNWVFNEDETELIIGSTSPVNPFLIDDGEFYNHGVSYSAELTLLVMTGEGEAIMTFPYITDDTDSPLTFRWSHKIIKISGGGSVATQVHTGTTRERIIEFIQSLVYAGEGVLVGKRVMGFKNPDVPAVDPQFEYPSDVTFVRSTDAGVTWAPIEATGFTAPLKNIYFGNLFVDRAKAGDVPARLLIPSWDPTAQAYYVFSSVDNGSTWKREARIAKPDTFRRMDQLQWFDGGGNFQTLAYIGSGAKARPVDLALPERYVRTTTP